MLPLSYFHSSLTVLQPIRKWAARFDLGFSTSVPVLEFKLEDIHFIDDECKYPPSLSLFRR
jgi:hypothetical protein